MKLEDVYKMERSDPANNDAGQWIAYAGEEPWDYVRTDALGMDLEEALEKLKSYEGRLFYGAMGAEALIREMPLYARGSA